LNYPGSHPGSHKKLQIIGVSSINYLVNTRNVQKRNINSSPADKRNLHDLPSNVFEIEESEEDADDTPQPQVKEFRMDESILFTYVRVMKSITMTFDKPVYSESQYIITEEEGHLPDKKFDFEDLKAWFNKCFYTIIRVVMVLLLLWMNSLFMKLEMFLGVYVYITLINNTRRSIISQDLKTMSICLKRWY